MGAMLEFYKATANGSGSAVQLKSNASKNLYWEITNQTPGTTHQTKSFDWKSKQIFELSLEELQKLINWSNWAMSQAQPQELKFPHLASKMPKNIIFKYQNYNNNWQIALTVMPSGAKEPTNQDPNVQQISKVKNYNFSLEQFSVITAVIKGHIGTYTCNNGLLKSVLIKSSDNTVYKTVDSPKLDKGDFVICEKKDGNGIKKEFLEITTCGYNYVSEQMEYWVKL